MDYRPMRQEDFRVCKMTSGGNPTNKELISTQEKTQLTQLETSIEKNLKAFYEVGSALMMIQEFRFPMADNQKINLSVREYRDFSHCTISAYGFSLESRCSLSGGF